MNIEYIFAIGLMSGTSLDGIDLVYARFEKINYKNYSILQAETLSYNKHWKQLLQNAIFADKTELQRLDILFGNHLAKIINNFIHKYKIDKIDFIASHGHTILHQPEKGITLQIGNGKILAEKTKQKVICDFRTQDVKFGGQGAPLVPIGDELLFSDYDFCLNLGGFSNISFKKNGQRIAFDVSPVNVVLNHYSNKINLEFDNKGKIASEGKINQQLLNKLNALDFYQQHPPKSLGLEWVQSTIFPLIDAHEKEIPNILRTFTAHIAIQIGQIIKNNSAVLVTGGGVFNTFLMNSIEHNTNVKITLPSKELINFKEALIFAFLGVLRLDNQVNCLASVTGAIQNHSSGVIFNP